MTHDLAPHFGSQMAIAPLIVAGLGAALARGLGGLFGNKSKQKKEDAAAKETQRSNVATHDQSEQRRIAILRMIQGQAGSRGIDFPIDEAMLQARPYTGADPTKVTQAGRGSGLASSILSGLGGLGGDIVQAKQQQSLLSAGQPTGSEIPGLDPDTLAQVASEAGVSTEEVADLVKEMLAEQEAKKPHGVAMTAPPAAPPKGY